MQISAAEGLWTLQCWEFSGRPSLCHQRCFGELGWVLLADCDGRDSKSLLVSEEPDNDATVATAISCSSWQSNSLCIGLIRAGFNFKGEGKKLGWEKVMWVVDIRWGKPMWHQNKNYNETKILEKSPDKPKFGFLLAWSPDHVDCRLGDFILLSATGCWQMGLLGVLSFVIEELISLVFSTRKRQVQR